MEISLWNKLWRKKTDEFRTIKVGENFIMVASFTYSTDSFTAAVFQENLDSTNNFLTMA
jgi:hypothetical protein